MIVVDTNVIVLLLVHDDEELPLAPLIEELSRLDATWYAPALWRSELRSVLLRKLRAGNLTMDEAEECLIDADQLLGERTCEPDPVQTLDLALQSGCTAYDCEFVAVAHALAAPLVTLDRQVLTAFPDVAVSPDLFLRMHGSE